MKLFSTTRREGNERLLNQTERGPSMPNWTHHDLHKHMHVYASDNSDLGHITDVYEDSFAIHAGLLTHKRYLPYSAVASVEHDKVQLQMSAAAVHDVKWEKRPDYEKHLGDPTQLVYDRGHGIHDPFEEDNPDKA
jgi:hypothetical protein